MSQTIEDRIQSYLSENMSSSEKTAFESEILHNTELKKEYLRYQRVEEGIEALGRTQVERSMVNIRQNHGPLKVPDSTLSERWKVWNNPNRWSKGIAAAIALLVVSSIFLYIQSSSLNTEGQFAYLPTPLSLGDRAVEEGFNLYAEGEYEQALLAFREVSPSSPDYMQSKLFEGFAHLKKERPNLDNALAAFHLVIEGSVNRSWVDYAEWNELLIYLKKGEYGIDYQRTLQSIRNDSNHKFYDRLKDLSLPEKKSN